VANRVSYDAECAAYDLEDTYSQPFRRAIHEGGAAGIMYACNKVGCGAGRGVLPRSRIVAALPFRLPSLMPSLMPALLPAPPKVNGVPAVASADLAGRLRSWGFTGYRTTDGDGIGGISDPARQNYTKNSLDSIGIAMTDGESDIDDGSSYSTHLVDALAAGTVSKATVQRALFNTLRVRFRLGLFDPVREQRWAALTPARDVDTQAAQQLNYEATRQGLVLLQNHPTVAPAEPSRKIAGAAPAPSPPPTLPFAVPAAGRVVIVGASANSTRLLAGGHYARAPTAADGFLSLPDALQRLLAAAGSAAVVEVQPGLGCAHMNHERVCVQPKRDGALLAAALAAAAAAEQVVVVLNSQSLSPCDSDAAAADGEEFNPCGYEAEQHDRPHSTPPKLQNEVALAVLKAARAAGVPAAVVLVHGGGLAIDDVKAAATGAIVDAHYPGEAFGGPALAGLLYGEFGPAGKLPYSLMPKAFDEGSNFTSMSMTTAPGRTYKYFTGAALWPFGFGLSYSRWAIGVPPADAASAAAAAASWVVHSPAAPPAAPPSPMVFAIDVRNVGLVDSDEVIQVYFAPQFVRPGVPTPFRQLIDFERLHLAAGASATLRFTVQSAQLQLAGADGKRSLHPVGSAIAFLCCFACVHVPRPPATPSPPSHTPYGVRRLAGRLCDRIHERRRGRGGGEYHHRWCGIATTYPCHRYDTQANYPVVTSGRKSAAQCARSPAQERHRHRPEASRAKCPSGRSSTSRRRCRTQCSCRTASGGC
jgi:beta-glucosidase-like glycosyl hydrolase